MTVGLRQRKKRELLRAMVQLLKTIVWQYEVSKQIKSAVTVGLNRLVDYQDFDFASKWLFQRCTHQSELNDLEQWKSSLVSHFFS